MDLVFILITEMIKVEICRYGCPDHCQKPNSYERREQQVSASLGTNSYNPGPRFEAQKSPVYQSGASPAASSFAQRTVQTEQEEQERNREVDRNRDIGRQFIGRLDEPEQKSKEKDFLGFKLPRLPPVLSNLFGGKQAADNVQERNATSPARVSENRTDKKSQPLVYRSSLNAQGGNVNPQEAAAVPIGPRGIKFDKTRQRRSAEMGVRSTYQVISEVDLAFKPSFETGMGATVFQVNHQDFFAKIYILVS